MLAEPGFELRQARGICIPNYYTMLPQTFISTTEAYVDLEVYGRYFCKN